MTIQQLTAKIEEMIQSVQQGSATQYTTFFCKESEVNWKIRVSDHNANPERADDNTISFIVPANDKDDDESCSYNALHINKKTFKSMPNQYVIIDGCDENGYSIEDLITYHIQ